MPAISVIITCKNARDTIEAACASAAWADELVVVDSLSTDETPDLARRFTNHVHSEPWRGYSEQKAFAASLASNDWVFVLDSDEAIPRELADEICSLPDSAFDAADVMYVRRRNFVLGRAVRAWWPDWQSRLIHRARVSWSDDALHENRLPSDRSRVRSLKGWIEHKRHSADGFADYFSGARMDERLIMVARQMHAQGKRASGVDLAVRPVLAFLKFYIAKRGFLDGTFGLLIAQKAMLSAQLKYAALWAVQQGLDTPDKKPGGDG